MLRATATALSFLLLAGAATAGGIEIGDKAPEFSGLEGTDGKTHSIEDYKKEVLVVCITCNHCPVAVAYEDRLVEFNKKFGEKVDFVAINVNNMDADKLPKMKERAEEKGFTFDYLYDPSQQIARKLGAKVTPEFFVFNKDRELVYHGAMDDNWQAAASVKKTYLVDAVDAVLSGSKPTDQTTQPKGCGIKYEGN